MSYTFRGNFQFELAKACISQQRIPAPPGRPSLAEALNYACHFRSLRARAKFRSKQGIPLRIESSPFCSQQPEQISLLALRGKNKRGKPKSRQTAASSEEAPIAREPAPNATLSPVEPQDNEALPSKRHKLAPALLSVTLAVLVAVTVGMAIGHNNAFRMKSPQLAQDTTTTVQPVLPAPIASAAAAAPDAVALMPSLAPTLQESIAAPLPEPKVAQSHKHVKHVKKKQTKPHTAPDPAPPAEAFSKESPPLNTQAAPIKKAPLHQAVRAALAKCQRYGLIARERCKWHVCNHKWGKDGCPAYAQPSNQTMMGIAFAVTETQSAASSPHN